MAYRKRISKEWVGTTTAWQTSRECTLVLKLRSLTCSTFPLSIRWGSASFHVAGIATSGESFVCAKIVNVPIKIECSRSALLSSWRYRTHIVPPIWARTSHWMWFASWFPWSPPELPFLSSPFSYYRRIWVDHQVEGRELIRPYKCQIAIVQVFRPFQPTWWRGQYEIETRRVAIL